MKTAILSLAAIIVSSSLLHADFSERKLTSTIASATKSGKLIAFVFYQDYALPNCPKCITRTDAGNRALKDAIPRPNVVVVEINQGDKGLDQLPACVGSKAKAPCIVITDAQGKEVIAKAGGTLDREKAKELKELVEKARAGA